MIDIKHFIASLKIWIRRLLQIESKYKKLFEIAYSKIDNFLMYGNDYFTKIKGNYNNSFWNNVFNAWNSLSMRQKPGNINDIKDVSIWYNKDICINKCPVFFKSWSESGILFIKDLLNEDGNLISYREFTRKYVSVRSNFLEYLGIKSAIESYIKKLNIQNKKVSLLQVDMLYFFRIVFKSKKGSKDFYNVLNNNNTSVRSQEKWKSIPDIDWKSLYITPF